MTDITIRGREAHEHERCTYDAGKGCSGSLVSVFGTTVCERHIATQVIPKLKALLCNSKFERELGHIKERVSEYLDGTGVTYELRPHYRPDEPPTLDVYVRWRSRSEIQEIMDGVIDSINSDVSLARHASCGVFSICFLPYSIL